MDDADRERLRTDAHAILKHHVWMQVRAAEVLALLDSEQALRAELADAVGSAELYADLLSRTAAAVGKPRTSTWNDLPECVAGLEAQIAGLADVILELRLRGTEDEGACGVAGLRLRELRAEVEWLRAEAITARKEGQAEMSAALGRGCMSDADIGEVWPDWVYEVRRMRARLRKVEEAARALMAAVLDFQRGKSFYKVTLAAEDLRAVLDEKEATE